MRGGRILCALALVTAASLLASCSFTPAPVTTTASKEYFSPEKYGPASPRVVASGEVPKGGGHYMVGDPYRVAGRTYIPRDYPRYSKVGLASWYGSAFHGRLTANGEVYDVNGLTAAHPTLPLPSYVRVTNVDNGRSVIVRVNDRGPFARNRLIDVSSRAADMLGFRQIGTAEVRVDYVGPARLDGQDERMLLASYRGPKQDLWQGGGGTRLASNQEAVVASAEPAPVPDPQPELRPAVADGDPMVLTPAVATASIYSDQPVSYSSTTTAYAGGKDSLGTLILRSGLTRSYAETPPPTPAVEAATELSTHDLTTALTAAAQRKAREIAAARAIPAAATIQLGSFSTVESAKRIAMEFGRFGRTQLQARDFAGRTLQVVLVNTDGSVAPQSVVDAARAEGLSGAFIVR